MNDMSLRTVKVSCVEYGQSRCLDVLLWVYHGHPYRSERTDFGWFAVSLWPQPEILEILPVSVFIMALSV